MLQIPKNIKSLWYPFSKTVSNTKSMGWWFQNYVTTLKTFHLTHFDRQSLRHHESWQQSYWQGLHSHSRTSLLRESLWLYQRLDMQQILMRNWRSMSRRPRTPLLPFDFPYLYCFCLPMVYTVHLHCWNKIWKRWCKTEKT